MRARVAVLLCAAPLVACAGTGIDLKRESARAITPTPYPDSVTISDVHSDHLGTLRRWVATTRDGVYECSIKTSERVPLCARRDPPR